MNLLEAVGRYWPYRWVPEIYSETASITQVQCQHVFVGLIEQNRQRGLDGSGMAFMMEQNLINHLVNLNAFRPHYFIYQIGKN